MALVDDSKPRHRKKTSKAKVARLLWLQQAVKMRLAGATMQEIADQIGKARETVSRAILEFMDRVRTENEAEARVLRDMELARLDRLMLAQWTPACAGDINAASMVLRIMERRARMQGLDAAVKVETNSIPPQFEGKTIRELLAQATEGMDKEELDKPIHLNDGGDGNGGSAR